MSDIRREKTDFFEVSNEVLSSFLRKSTKYSSDHWRNISIALISRYFLDNNDSSFKIVFRVTYSLLSSSSFVS